MSARSKEVSSGARMERIALFIADLEGGGAQRKMIALANAFAARGHPVDLAVVESGGLLTESVGEGVRILPLDSAWQRLSWVAEKKRRRVLASVPALAGYLRRERPAVLMSTSHSVNVAAVVAARLARASTRVVLRIDSSLTRSPELAGTKMQRRRLRRARRFFARADRIIAVSQGVGEDLLEQIDFPRERLTAIHNPVAIDELERRAREKPSHPYFDAPGPPIVVAVGRLVEQKDFSTLLRAFARVRSKCEARLLILGEGAERDQLESLARELGIERDCSLPGFDPNPAAALARAQVFVLSSAWEGFPNVVVEALACGCPVVSTDCKSGPREILDDGRVGPLVPVGDHEALADATLEMIERPTPARILLDRARDFSAGQTDDRYLDVLLG